VKIICSRGRCLQRCNNRDSSVEAGSSSSGSGSRESVDRSFQECQILKYRRLSRSMYQDSHYADLYLPVLLITPSCPFSVISFFHPSVYRTFLPYPISSLLYRSPLLHFPLSTLFPSENISTSVPKIKLPAFPIPLSNHLPTSSDVRARALLMKSRRYYAHAAMCTIYSWAVRANIKSFAATFCTGETTW